MLVSGRVKREILYFYQFWPLVVWAITSFKPPHSGPNTLRGRSKMPQTSHKRFGLIWYINLILNDIQCYRYSRVGYPYFLKQETNKTTCTSHIFLCFIVVPLALLNSEGQNEHFFLMIIVFPTKKITSQGSQQSSLLAGRC